MGKDDAAKAYGNGGETASGDPGSGWRTRAVTVAGRRMRVITVGALVLLLVLIGGAVGVYAYDSAHKDQIADGVKVGTVDVGGLNREQAAHRIRRHLVAPLHQPVKVKLGSERYELPADHLKIRADVNGMVDEAVAASQSWGVPGRVFRDLTSGSVDQTVQPQVSYSRHAVHRFVVHVTKKINREPQDATINSRDHWQRVMQGHAGANMMPVIASNRIGREQGESCAITFYGSSFIAGPRGEKIAEAGEAGETVLTASFDLEEMRVERAAWGFFRDRRPELYTELLTLDGGGVPQA